MVEKVLSYKEAAAAVGVTVRTLSKAVKQREIAHIRIGKRTVRFRQCDIEDYLERNAVPVGGDADMSIEDICNE